MKRAASLLGLMAITMPLITSSAANSQQTTLIVEGLKFVDHLAAGMIEQDVFVERTSGSASVFRLSKEDRDKYASVRIYGSSKPTHHAPFAADAMGPYGKGKPLGMTLKQWLAGAGTASYSCESGKARLKANFKNLVPGGVYTMWNFYVGKQHMGCPTCPFSTIDFPIGAPDGSQSVFSANPAGDAKLDVEFSPCLPLSNNRIATALAIAYHSDGRTYGPSPGEFGTSSHVQLLAVLPDAGAWQGTNK